MTFVDKIGEGKDKCEANHAAENTMTPLPKEDRLEVREGDRMVHTASHEMSRKDTRTSGTYSLNSGVALYFSNSSSHSPWESGGRTPVIGRHSVMLRPDSVRRVTPPTTITAKTSVDERRSQCPTPGVGRIGVDVEALDDSSFVESETTVEENLWRREETCERTETGELGERLKTERAEQEK